MVEKIILLPALEEFLDSKPDIHTAILFGSYARGSVHSESDLDFAIAKAKPLSSEEKLNLIYDLMIFLPEMKIDLVDLHSTEGLIDVEIFTKGQILKKDTEFWIHKLHDMDYYQRYYLPYLESNLIKRLKESHKV